MSSAVITSIECGAAGKGATARIIDEMLSGAESAGAAARRFLIPTQDPGDPVESSGVEILFDGAGLEAAIEALADADHAIIGAGALPLISDKVFEKLRNACYRQARWVTLADLDGRDGFQITLRPGQRLEDFSFPTPRRELSNRHRGLVILTPPDDAPDHDDPFAENSFFLLEELLRLMGFTPSGRILATGMYFPPIDQNPVLQQQAFDLGRKLVRGAVAV